MANKLKVGDRIVLHLKTSEVFEGVIDYLTKNSIELDKIFCHSNNSQVEGILIFYRDEVRTVSRLEKEISPNTTSDLSTSAPISPPSSAVSRPLPKPIKIPSGEFDRLKNMTQNFTYVHMFDNTFFDAVKALSNCESIGVACLGSTFSKSRPLSLLVMCSFKQVYIFDLMLLGQLRTLRDLLISPYIAKVVHNGKPLAYYFHHRHGIKIRNIFDTQFFEGRGLLPVESSNAKRNLAEALEHNLNFPVGLLEPAMEHSADHHWTQRPLLKSQKIMAAQYVAYLLTLRDRLMNDLMESHNRALSDEYEHCFSLDESDILKLTNQLSLGSSRNGSA